MEQFARSLGLGVAVAIDGVVTIAMAPWVDLEQSLGLPWLYAARGPVRVPDAVAIVAIDTESAEALGVAERPHDWPRGMHADLVRWLAASGARLIIFDMTFDTPSAQPEQDAALAEAMAVAGNVLVSESLRKQVLTLEGSGGKPSANVVIERASPPIPIIARALLGQAPFVALEKWFSYKRKTLPSGNTWKRQPKMWA